MIGPPDRQPPAPLIGEVFPAGSCTDVGDLPGTICRQVRVTCPDLADIEVRLRVTEPSAAASRGTIVVGSGGDGTGWWSRPNNAPAQRRLLQEGFRIVERAWVSPWEAGSAGMAASACRYATLLTFVRSSFSQGALCASGNSGGATEIAYALARYDGESVLDFAVPTSGPPMGRMDRACLDGDDPAWQAECDALWTASGTQCSAAQTSCAYTRGADLIDLAYAPNTPCRSQDPAARGELESDSTAADGGDFEHPDTPLHFLFGARDCSEAVPLGLMHAQRIVSRADIDVLPNVGHGVHATSAGARAIFDAMMAGCRVP